MQYLYVVALLLLAPGAKAWTSSKQTSRHAFRRLSMSTMEDSATQKSPAQLIKKGSIVTIDCRLKPEGDFVPEPLFDGIVLHDEEPDARLTFVLGGGNYLPGLHDLVATLQQPGDSVENVSLDAGWGARNPNLVATLTFAAAGVEDPSLIKPGVKLYLSNNMQCIVTDVTKDTFTIDANPPLAGASYSASVKLISVEDAPVMTEYSEEPLSSSSRYQVATFALGCFWGGELEFMREPGVVGTAVGYTHGFKEAPTYKEVCSGSTGHTEAIAVTYDPAVVSYERLVRLAMDRLGDNKYLLNQVGNDRGTQYRHGVYYHTSEQKKIAEEVLRHWGETCVTECKPARKFWFAEDYHQQYLLKGGQSARKGDDSVIRCYG